MITVLPAREEAKRSEILGTLGIEDARAEALELCCAQERRGAVAVLLEERKLKLIGIWAAQYDFKSPPNEEQAAVLDMLVRSAASYAEHFGADVIEAGIPDFFGFLGARGFAVSDGVLSVPVSSIVKYTG